MKKSTALNFPVIRFIGLSGLTRIIMLKSLSHADNVIDIMIPVESS